MRANQESIMFHKNDVFKALVVTMVVEHQCRKNRNKEHT